MILQYVFSFPLFFKRTSKSTAEYLSLSLFFFRPKWENKKEEERENKEKLKNGNETGKKRWREVKIGNGELEANTVGLEIEGVRRNDTL